MRNLSLILLTCLFLLSPTVVMGQSLDGIVQKGSDFLCKSTGVGCPETIDAKDLVERHGLYYKKFSDAPFNGEVTGRLQGRMKNGKKYGPWNNFHENGQLNIKGTYKDGKWDGPWFRYYHKNGQLMQKGTYKDGKEDGPWVGYYRNGQLSGRVTYKDGKQVGLGVSYYENGQLWSKGHYKNGEKDGTWVWYNLDGTMWREGTGTFKNGKKISD